MCSVIYERQLLVETLHCVYSTHGEIQSLHTRPFEVCTPRSTRFDLPSKSVAAEVRFPYSRLRDSHRYGIRIRKPQL